MNTRFTDKYPVSEEEFGEIVYRETTAYREQIVKDIAELVEGVERIHRVEDYIYFVDSEIWLDSKHKVMMPKLEHYKAKKITTSEIPEGKMTLDNEWLVGGMQPILPKVSHLRAQKDKLISSGIGAEQYLCICDDSRYGFYGSKCIYDPMSGMARMINKDVNEMVTVIPEISLYYCSVKELLVKYMIPFGLCPESLDEKGRQCLSDLSVCYKKDPNLIALTSSGSIIFSGSSYLTRNYQKDHAWAENLQWGLAEVLKKYYDQRSIGNKSEDIRKKLLNCEKVRADIDPYEERLLTDPNRGHWDLWSEHEDQYRVEMNEELVARNPQGDINENGVIAIDFGTKSTIVVYQSDIEYSLPMGIGDGNLSKEPSPKRYENPTVMHFVDLESFLNAYKLKEGRPETKWDDLTMSHTAKDQFANSQSGEYYEYLHQLKQWAGQREKQFRVRDHHEKTYVLPSFMDLKEDDWNPIELYAYYIGLYINNMRKGHGIFLDYYLSFPVTYEIKIREKIIKSFEKGLKKSLPTSILENEEIMKRFHVNGDISEPAAYAVCALQEYGFEPEDDDEVFYGIFDFGGGTTDFDFGLWTQSSKRRYDYKIENFGAGGDEYLGGENLLEMLAFEVFKDNQAYMREKGYTFTLAPKCTEFLGSDALLADSQEAEKNMHNLMEKLRPYWETSESTKDKTNDEKNTLEIMTEAILKSAESHPQAEQIENQLQKIIQNQKEHCDIESIKIGYLIDLCEQYGLKLEDNSNDQIKFVVTLFDKDGQDHPGETLYFSRKKLNQIIVQRICDGVNNFFSALLLSYQNDKVKKPKTVNIFLAGNSCKSPIVRRVFEEIISEQEGKIREKYNIKTQEKMFEIFPPLGTEEAYQKMESRGLTPSRGNFEKPTGKTGVAFGLIQCRKGGTIERITNQGIEDEIPFQYFIGWRSKKKFVIFKDDSKITKYKGKPDYNEWYKFIEADENMFDLYYTTLPECITGELAVEGNPAVKRLRCEIDTVDEDAFVYIRAVDPHTLEYAVAKSDDVEKTKLGSIIRKEL